MSGCRAGRRFRRVTPQLGIIVPAGASASAARTDPRRMPLHARERMIAAYRQDHYRYPRSIPARYNPTLQTSCTHMSQRTMHAHYMRMAICEGQRPQRIQNRRKLSNHPGFSSTGKDTQQTPSDSFGRAPLPQSGNTTEAERVKGTNQRQRNTKIKERTTIATSPVAVNNRLATVHRGRCPAQKT